ncbi:hypothetical protein SAMN05720473_11249 [Fibrobacter sp. UWB15]|jgi:hypothetical protein|uniref:DUF1302 family protein n=1 Tax=unclassified Fibrobacter TaxID=2634177 RepID=UPI00091EF7FA|nr:MULTISPECIES: DUF1302 family protein [unclassified Fibrobacter]PWJ62164.1 hypothetical protein BGW99_11349 [Fibrobacter sp. UWB6]SHG54302.1 hypothetical protein SAMN05720760_11419 [Fibrobacter sp. UWB8]SMG41489.1 hypothetical protein SAMN05720473_11249 [Fibrobacter sp. UWB15]
MKRFTALGLAFAATVCAQETVFLGSLTSQAGVGLPNTHHNKGDFLLGQTIFDGTIKSYLDEAMVYVNGQIVHDALGAQSTNGSSAFVADDGTYALKLREAYIDWKGEMIALRIGRQIVSWGKADDIQITDVLNPRDETNVVASDYNESKLGIDAVRLSLLTEKTQVDAYWIPFFTPSILPLAKGNPLHSRVFPEEVDGIGINYPEKYDDFELPKKRLSKSELALRASTYTSVADLSLYGFYGWDDLPLIRYNPNIVFGDGEDMPATSYSIDVTGEYKRMYMIGADAAIPAGDFVFRLEGAYFPKRHFQTDVNSQLFKYSEDSRPASKRKNQVLGLAGLDWTPSGGWTITAQYVADAVIDYDSDIERKKFEHQATMSIEKSILNETLTIMASGALDLWDFSTASELELDYKLTDAITLSLIGDLYLEGPDGKEGLYGEYRDFSSVTFKGKMSF